MNTVTLLDQLRASRAIYERELERMESLSDVELHRVLDIASAATVARVLGFASAAVARVLGFASAATVDRVLGFASAATVARVLDIASDATVARVLDIASDATVARVLGFASAAVARVQSLATITVPVVADLDKRVAEAVNDGGLEMGSWHCGTTHCRGGWAVTLAGEAGAKLEKALGTESAARLIYEASTGRIAPDFFASNKDALDDIRRCAQEVA